MLICHIISVKKLPGSAEDFEMAGAQKNRGQGDLLGLRKASRPFILVELGVAFCREASPPN